MDNLLQKEYIHIGNNKIQRDLWYDVQNSEKKPTGGLWTSPYIKECVCDWLEYVGMNPDQFVGESVIKGCLIKLKEDSKLCYMQNEHSLKRFKDYMNNDILDFERLSKEYDLFYVNPEGFHSFYNWTVRTMYILNINAIESYIPLDISYKKVSPYYYHYSINKMYPKESVEDYSNSYYHLYNIFLEKYYSTLSLSNKNDIKRKLLEEYKNSLLENKNASGICDAIVENELLKIKKLKR